MGAEKGPSAADAWAEEYRWTVTGSEMYSKWQNDRVEVLRMVPLFGGLGRRHLDRIAKYVAEKQVETGTLLARQGKREPDFLSIIVDGTARVERDGHVLAHLKAGDICGEMSLIDGQPRSASVFTESPCVLLVIDRPSFHKLLDSVPGLQKTILVTLCQRLRDADTALAAVN